jgi:hypothetical protein
MPEYSALKKARRVSDYLMMFAFFSAGQNPPQNARWPREIKYIVFF